MHRAESWEYFSRVGEAGIAGQKKRTSARDKAEILELVGPNYLKVKNDKSLKEIEPCS